jgi:hypothetical protein
MTSCRVRLRLALAAITALLVGLAGPVLAPPVSAAAQPGVPLYQEV